MVVVVIVRVEFSIYWVLHMCPALFKCFVILSHLTSFYFHYLKSRKPLSSSYRWGKKQKEQTREKIWHSSTLFTWQTQKNNFSLHREMCYLPFSYKCMILSIQSSYFLVILIKINSSFPPGKKQQRVSVKVVVTDGLGISETLGSGGESSLPPVLWQM